MFKSNTRNLKLLLDHFERELRREESHLDHCLAVRRLVDGDRRAGLLDHRDGRPALPPTMPTRSAASAETVEFINWLALLLQNVGEIAAIILWAVIALAILAIAWVDHQA